MTDTVKRSYSSDLRAEQARTTRRAIVDAAARLFTRHGYGATTVDAIAAEAGVSRKTVFTAVGGKLACLKLGIDWAVAGDDADMPLMARERIRAQMQEPDARAILRDYADMLCTSAARVARLQQALYDAVGLDPEIKALREEFDRQRMVGMANLAAHLELRGALRDDLTVEQAAHVLCLYHSTYHALVVEHDWSHERFISFLADSFIASLIRPNYVRQPLPRTKRAAHLGVDITPSGPEGSR